MHAKGITDKHKWGREEDFITLNIYSLNITNKKQKIVRLDFCCCCATARNML